MSFSGQLCTLFFFLSITQKANLWIVYTEDMFGINFTHNGKLNEM